MAYQVLKQPDGDLAIWSTYSDQFAVVDATEDEILKWFVDLAAVDAAISAQRVINAVQEGQPRKIYAQFALTWGEVASKYPPKGTEF